MVLFVLTQAFDVEATAATPSAIAVLRSPFGPRTLRQVRVFDFDSGLQRMSAVVWDPVKSTCFVALKGSPEMVASLCDPATGTAPSGCKRLIWPARTDALPLATATRSAAQPQRAAGALCAPRVSRHGGRLESVPRH